MRRAILMGCVVGALVVGAPAGARVGRESRRRQPAGQPERGDRSVLGPGLGRGDDPGLAGRGRAADRRSLRHPRLSGASHGQGRQLFVGGAGGSARLTQVVALRAPGGGPEPAGTRYRVSAWLGGSTTSAASVTVTLRVGDRTRRRSQLDRSGGRSRSHPGPAGGERRASARRGSGRGHLGSGHLAHERRRAERPACRLRPGGRR